MSTKETFKIYDAVFSSPGMLDSVKIDLRVSRKNVLLLARLIENGLKEPEKSKDEMFVQLPKEVVEELLQIPGEFLKKAGLSEFYGKLTSL
jgi:hypothetical protein